jgi:uncharacterized membrane protein YbhN (UPF0104 family)
MVMDNPEAAFFADRARPGVTQMTQAGRSWQGRVPYRMLSLLVSGTLLALGIALVYRRIDWREVATVWTHLDPTLVMLATGIYWLQYPINTARLNRVILWLGNGSLSMPSPGFLFRLTCSSGFVAAAAPIGLAGDAARIAALRLFGGLSITDAARAALFDRVVGVQWICLIGLATLPLQGAAGIGRDIIIPQLIIFAGLTAAVGALLVLPKALGMIKGEFVAKIARVFTGYRSMLTPKRSAVQAVIALLNLASAGGALYLLLMAAGSTASVWLVVAFIPLLQLVNGLPFLYMGWGGREIAMAGTLGAASSLTVNETLAVSIAWGVVMIATGAVNGVFLIGDWHVDGEARAAAADLERSAGP